MERAEEVQKQAVRGESVSICTVYFFVFQILIIKRIVCVLLLSPLTFFWLTPHSRPSVPCCLSMVMHICKQVLCA